MVINSIQMAAIKKIAIHSLLSAKASLVKAIDSNDLARIWFFAKHIRETRKFINETIPSIEGAPIRRAFPKARKGESLKPRK